MKNKKCAFCEAAAREDLISYRTKSTDVNSGEVIAVPNVAQFTCTNLSCGRVWIPKDEFEKIETYVAARARHRLSSEDIALIREALNFDTKTDAAKFLCLNAKAFVKWEGDYTQLNAAYDLLLRLAVLDRRNFDFIAHLHNTNFRFEPSKYGLIRERHQNGFIREVVSVSPVSTFGFYASWAEVCIKAEMEKKDTFPQNQNRSNEGIRLESKAGGAGPVSGWGGMSIAA